MQERLISVIELIGEYIWLEGLLSKGNGLCHGISGNGYMLHNVYKTFDKLSLKEPETYGKDATMWKTRAYMFAQATYDE